MKMKLPMLILSIQSINDIITNSSSEVVIRYDKEGVSKLKDLVNSIIEPFTTLKFDDLFTLSYIDEDYDEVEYKEYSEDHEDLDTILEESWKRTWDGGYPTVTIKIVPKEGKDCMGTAAKLLENISHIFDTDIVYG